MTVIICARSDARQVLEHFDAIEGWGADEIGIEIHQPIRDDKGPCHSAPGCAGLAALVFEENDNLNNLRFEYERLAGDVPPILIASEYADDGEGGAGWAFLAAYKGAAAPGFEEARVAAEAWTPDVPYDLTTGLPDQRGIDALATFRDAWWAAIEAMRHRDVLARGTSGIGASGNTLSEAMRQTMSERSYGGNLEADA